jgi:outer membrane lipoprotein carrier protein
MNRRGGCFAAGVLLAAGMLALHAVPGTAAQSGTALDRYLDSLTTWSANFSQRVVDENGKQVDGGTGRLVIVRPGKLRWETQPDGEDETALLTVADGCSLWSYDIELESVTVKPLNEALSQSPVMLLVGQASLREAFDVTGAGRRENLDWVAVKPRGAESDFREAQFAFRGSELARLVITDKLGQRATLSFSNVRRNAAVDPKLVQFEVPEGVDLIGKPVCP